MELLRNKSLSTQILILYELYTNEYSTLVPVAEHIGVTQQAISEYLKKMKQKGLVKKNNRLYKPTIQGIHLLQSELFDLKRFIDDCVQHLSSVTNSVALAKTPISKGEHVGLFMEDGWLVAYAHKMSTSTAIALTKASIGEYITVGNLQGIIEHSVGKLIFIELTDPFNEPAPLQKRPQLQQQLQCLNIDKIGILDTVAKTMCQFSGIKPDFEFGVLHAAMNAAERGFTVALLGYKQNIRDVLSNFETINERSNEKISYDLIVSK